MVRNLKMSGGWAMATLMLGAVAMGTELDPQRIRLSATGFVWHAGAMNASAGVPLGVGDAFLMANDEDNRLRVYRWNESSPSVNERDLNGQLRLPAGSKEADFEGGARVGDRIYWIGSHGRGPDGSIRPNRHCLVGTRVRQSPKEGHWDIQVVGRTYTQLMARMMQSVERDGIDLRRASGKAPEKGGVNIEGLASGPNGELWVGFRSPLIQGKALIVPVLNPAEAIEGKDAKIGDAVLLDLGGRGIRSMERHENRYFIIGGSASGGRDSDLFIWDGLKMKPDRVKLPDLGNWNPEGLMIVPREGALAVDGQWVDEKWGGWPLSLILLSDDGSDKRQRLLPGPGFRSIRIDVD